MSDGKNEDESKNLTSRVDTSKSWSSIFYDFLSEPPTTSFFRLYLLCFVIWNKKILLYIFFDNASMSEKLMYGYYYFTPLSNINFFYNHPYLLIYGGPLVLVYAINTIVFGRKIGKWEIQSIYKKQGLKHHLASYEFERERFNILENTKSLKNSNDEAPLRMEYYEFKARQAYYDTFVELAIIKEKFPNIDFYSEVGNYVIEKKTLKGNHLRDLSREYGLIFIDESLNYGQSIISLTQKGQQFYQFYKRDLERGVF